MSLHVHLYVVYTCTFIATQHVRVFPTNDGIDYSLQHTASQTDGLAEGEET